MSEILQSILLKPIEIAYAICAVSLFLIGTNFLVSAIIYMRNWKKAWGLQTPDPPKEWPHVTVQLPIYNERYLAERILKAVTQFDYPADKLEIQVLDDSNDWTTNLLIGLVEKYRRQGVDIKYLHREDRYGFKAGNLSFGLQYAKGEFTAIFDADFIPPRNWLKRTIPFFQDPKVGFVQTRWDHINYSHNMITRMAGLTLDGHFIVEQSARSTAGLIMGFNGSAGIWRVATIESVGQLCVFKSEQMQQRGVEVVDVDLVLDGLVAEGIGCAIVEAAFDSRSGQPDGEAIGVVIAPLVALRIGSPSELTTPDDEG